MSQTLRERMGRDPSYEEVREEYILNLPLILFVTASDREDYFTQPEDTGQIALGTIQTGHAGGSLISFSELLHFWERRLPSEKKLLPTHDNIFIVLQILWSECLNVLFGYNNHLPLTSIHSLKRYHDTQLPDGGTAYSKIAGGGYLLRQQGGNTGRKPLDVFRLSNLQENMKKHFAVVGIDWETPTGPEQVSDLFFEPLVEIIILELEKHWLFPDYFLTYGFSQMDRGARMEYRNKLSEFARTEVGMGIAEKNTFAEWEIIFTDNPQFETEIVETLCHIFGSLQDKAVMLLQELKEIDTNTLRISSVREHILAKVEKDKERQHILTGQDGNISFVAAEKTEGHIHAELRRYFSEESLHIVQTTRQDILNQLRELFKQSEAGQKIKQSLLEIVTYSFAPFAFPEGVKRLEEIE